MPLSRHVPRTMRDIHTTQTHGYACAVSLIPVLILGEATTAVNQQTVVNTRSGRIDANSRGLTDTRWTIPAIGHRDDGPSGVHMVGDGVRLARLYRAVRQTAAPARRRSPLLHGRRQPPAHGRARQGESGLGGSVTF